ncbi:MAG: aldose epimerase family protein [Breznakibacter sp.]
MGNQKFNIIDEANFVGSFKGKATCLRTLRNKNGLVVQVTNFGAKIVSIYVPDRNGKFADVVAGFSSIGEYIGGNPYFGAICGRYANRIANATYTIDGVVYQLPVNNGPNHLHGGPEGFNNQVFDISDVRNVTHGQAVELSYLCADGEMGHPGNLNVKVTYTLTEDNELVLDYEATTDKNTHVNICSHSFFNLAGHDGPLVTDHELMINAKTFTPVNQFQIPIGEFREVKGTSFDFVQMHRIGDHIDDGNDQISYGKGYDHNWVIDKPTGELGLAAVYHEPTSGRVMEVYTTQPGVQLYTSNWLDGSDRGKDGVTYQMRSSLCLETQNYPDSPNQPAFPSTLLKPGQVYKNSCVHKFSAK